MSQNREGRDLSGCFMLVAMIILFKFCKGNTGGISPFVWFILIWIGALIISNNTEK